jgi:hypothetical protein
MFGWFKKDPAKALERKIARKQEEAVALQRNGRLREYGALMKEIEGLEDELIALTANG